MSSQSEVYRVLEQIRNGDPVASAQLLPLVYQELRELAAAKMRHERQGQTLSATGLVHEAYLRLVGSDIAQDWNNKGHFFASAAEAMRRILVDRARKRKAVKHGGGLNKVELSDFALLRQTNPDEILALDDLIEVLAKDEPAAAELVKLKIFADFSVQEAGKLLGMSRRTAYRHWTYARAWLLGEMTTSDILN